MALKESFFFINNSSNMSLEFCHNGLVYYNLIKHLQIDELKRIDQKYYYLVTGVNL